MYPPYIAMISFKEFSENLIKKVDTAELAFITPVNDAETEEMVPGKYFFLVPYISKAGDCIYGNIYVNIPGETSMLHLLEFSTKHGANSYADRLFASRIGQQLTIAANQLQLQYA